MKPDYVIELEGSKVNLLFCTKGYMDLTEALGIDMETLYDNIFNGKMYKAKDFLQLLLTAANAYKFSVDEDETYTMKDAYQWGDEIGVFVTVPAVQEIYKIFAAKLMRVDPNLLQTEKVEEVKDDKPKKKRTKDLAGGGSTKKPLKVA